MKWIEQRMRGQEIRNKLTDYWSQNDVQEGLEYGKFLEGKALTVLYRVV